MLEGERESSYTEIFHRLTLARVALRAVSEEFCNGSLGRSPLESARLHLAGGGRDRATRAALAAGSTKERRRRQDKTSTGRLR